MGGGIGVAGTASTARSVDGTPIDRNLAGRHERGRAVRAVVATTLTAILGYVVLAAAAVGFGLLLTRELLHGVIGDWDVDVTTWLVERRTPTRTDLSLWGSRFSETLTVAIVLVVVFALLAVRRHWRELGIVAVAMAVEAATYATATYVVERHRPQVPRLEDLIVADSYFSGHAAAAVAMYGSLAIVVWRLTRNVALRVVFVVLAVAAPVIVALSRMYRGMHYASDVTVGALVGLGCIAVALVAVRAGARAFGADDAHDDVTEGVA
ncbi:MAG TPA: phosphatase PAP2 family protein [Acidimicrobiia bacterium]|nr:phosphatase PAP2 family protein [Acidimicrobiia bacterium]